MNRMIAPLLLASLSLVACGGAAPSTTAVPTTTAPTLDGSSYEVTLEFPGEAPVEDTLGFASGRFESTACTGFGFPRWTEYGARIDAGALAFDVVTHHPHGGSIAWHGTVRGDSVQGTADRTLDGKLAHGAFHGQVAMGRAP